jgi:hypothetical protein
MLLAVSPGSGIPAWVFLPIAAVIVELIVLKRTG